MIGEKYQRESNIVIKSGFWYTVSNFFLKGIAFITIPIFSRMLTTEEFGYYNNFAAWLAVLTIIGTLSLSTSLIRGRFDFKDDLDSFISSNLILGSICTIVLYFVAFFNKNIFESLSSLNFVHITIMFLSILFLPAYNMFQQLQRFQYKYKTLVTITICISIGSVLLSLVLMKEMEDTLLARIIGAQFPSFLASFTIYAFFMKKKKHIKLQYWKYSLIFSLPYVVHLLSNTVLHSVDRVMITKICGPEETALYSMAYNIALIVNVLWDSMNSAYSPWLGEKLYQRNYDSIKKYSYNYILFFAFILLGIMLVSPEALYVLGGKVYIEAKYVIPPMMLGIFFVFLYSMYVNIEQYEKKNGEMAIATCIAAVLDFILNLIFINTFGYIAAAYTTLFGYIFLFVLHYMLVKKIGLTKVYDTRFILIIILAETFFSVIITLSYQNNAIRYCLILLYCFCLVIIGYKYRTLILNMFRRE